MTELDDQETRDGFFSLHLGEYTVDRVDYYICSVMRILLSHRCARQRITLEVTLIYSRVTFLTILSLSGRLDQPFLYFVILCDKCDNMWFNITLTSVA